MKISPIKRTGDLEYYNNKKKRKILFADEELK